MANCEASADAVGGRVGRIFDFDEVSTIGQVTWQNPAHGAVVLVLPDARPSAKLLRCLAVRHDDRSRLRAKTTTLRQILATNACT